MSDHTKTIEAMRSYDQHDPRRLEAWQSLVYAIESGEGTPEIRDAVRRVCSGCMRDKQPGERCRYCDYTRQIDGEWYAETLHRDHPSHQRPDLLW